MIEILTRVPTAAEIERDLMIALILDHEPAGVRRASFFLAPIFVFLVAGQNSHPRVVDVKELSVRRQLNQMSVDGENRVRHILCLSYLLVISDSSTVVGRERAAAICCPLIIHRLKPADKPVSRD